MKTDPLKKGALTANGVGIGTVTPEMVRERAIELASIDGRSASDVSESDLEEAQRELTGGEEIDPDEAVLEAAPESERWDPLPGSTGHKVENTSNEDEDGEGRIDSERLFDEGVAEAELDQMNQAARAERDEEARDRQD